MAKKISNVGSCIVFRAYVVFSILRFQTLHHSQQHTTMRRNFLKPVTPNLFIYSIDKFVSYLTFVF